MNAALSVTIKNDDIVDTQTEMERYIVDNEDVYELLNTHRYVIIATTLDGGYFQSPTYDNYDDAAKDYRLFLGMVVYFGSGDAALYEYNSIGDVELVKYDVI